MAAKVSEIEAKIQRHVFERRVRAKEFFKDFDPLRSYTVTRHQFHRLLDNATMKLNPEEVEALSQHYADEKSGYIRYDAFLENIDKVFRTTLLEKTPLANPPAPGDILPPRFEPKVEAGREQELNDLLERIALLVKTRGVVFKYCFRDFDPLRSGFVTESRFRRSFPFKAFPDSEVLFLAEAFAVPAPDPSKSGRTDPTVNYMAIHDLVTTNTFAQEPPPPRSDLVLRPDPRVWEQQLLSAEQKIQSLVVMNRIRIGEFFHDFDKLRKGYVTRQQARSILDNLLAIKVPDADWEYLVDKYSRDDGMFCYAALCDAIDQAFTLKGLDKMPTVRINMPDPDTTTAARRNRMAISEQEAEELAELERQLAVKIRQTRKLLTPTFQDFDTTKRGHVTKSQFARALSMLGIELSPTQVDLLCLRYCNVGNHRDFDYREFVHTVDPGEDLGEKDRIKSLNESVYFNKKGKMIGAGRVN